MSNLPKPGRPGRDAWHLRVAILAKDRGAPRKVAWITTGSGGIFLGVARATGWDAKYSYRTDGGFYRSIQSQTPKGPRETQELVTKHPPIAEIKGLLQLLSVDVGAGDRLRGLPFKKRYESVYVKPMNGRVSFKLGLLEPGVPQALDSIKRKEERNFRLITRTEPWILLWNSAGFEAAVRR
jgi:hypothetical protein